jgi:peptide deformylase
VKLECEQIQQLEIVKYPHPVLRQDAETITEFDDNLQQLVLKMIELRSSNNGVGLAAPQVGLPLRLFVVNPTGEAGDEIVFINVEFLDGIGWAEDEEGCLSLPQIYGKVRRRQKVTVRAQDIKGETFELQAEDLLARILQHESDHLDGKLIIDRMSAIAKLSNRRQIKYLEELAQK